MKPTQKKPITAFTVISTIILLLLTVLFIFPFWLLVKKGLPVKKKLVYVFMPPIIFGCSFLPFVIGNIDALKGVIYNVFLYRSHAISPLLGKLLGIPVQFYFPLYILLLVVMAFLVRGQTYEYLLLLYFLLQILIFLLFQY